MKSPEPTKQQQRRALGDLTKNTITASSKSKPSTSTSTNATVDKMMPSVGSTPKPSAVRESRNRMSLSQLAVSMSRLDEDDLEVEPVAGSDDVFSKRSNDMPPPPSLPPSNITTPAQSQESEIRYDTMLIINWRLIY